MAQIPERRQGLGDGAGCLVGDGDEEARARQLELGGWARPAGARWQTGEAAAGKGRLRADGTGAGVADEQDGEEAVALGEHSA